MLELIATAGALGHAFYSAVMVVLVTTIHVFLCRKKSWMLGTSPSMTVWGMAGYVRRSLGGRGNERGAPVDIYHAWCNLKPGVGDLAFAEGVAQYMGHLKEQGLIAGWRLTRRKLGLAPAGFGEFHLMIEIENLAQLDAAFARAASRTEPTEGFHFGVNSLVQDAVFALYRDFPDAVRQKGQEKF